MTKVKESSTQHENKEFLTDCNLTYAVNLLSGRWKLPILLRIHKGESRFGLLKKVIPNITERMLALQLRELEQDGLLTRTIYPEVPLRVEYALTAIGQSLIPICNQLRDWGVKHKHQTAKHPSRCKLDESTVPKPIVKEVL